MSLKFDQVNADFIAAELNWLKLIVRRRRQQLLGSEDDLFALPAVQDPDNINAPYAKFLSQNNFSEFERLLLILALTPHIEPNLFEINSEHVNVDSSFVNLFGQKGKNYKGIMPTGQTFLYLAAGKDKRKWFEAQTLLVKDHLFARQQVLALLPATAGEPLYSGRIVMSELYVEYFTLGIQFQERNSIKNCISTQTS